VGSSIYIQIARRTPLRFGGQDLRGPGDIAIRQLSGRLWGSVGTRQYGASGHQKTLCGERELSNKANVSIRSASVVLAWPYSHCEQTIGS
jgi:hypothetical protein